MEYPFKLVYSKFFLKELLQVHVHFWKNELVHVPLIHLEMRSKIKGLMLYFTCCWAKLSLENPRGAHKRKLDWSGG